MTTGTRLAPLLLAVAAALPGDALPLAAQSITVGRNVWVSSATPSAGHYEVILAADPSDPKLLLAGSMVAQAGAGDLMYSVAYASGDGGKSWTRTLDVDRARGLDTQDPAVAFGPDRAAYFASWGRDARWNIGMLLSRSRDGGRSWLAPERTIVLDREFITVDNTGGRFRGRVYVNGQSDDRFFDSDERASSVWVVRLDPRHGEFLEPTHYASTGGRQVVTPTNGVVLADGTYVVGFVEHKQGVGSAADTVRGVANATLKVIASTDGGTSFGKAVIAAEVHDDLGRAYSNIPWLAADASPTSRYRGRLYAAWADARTGRSEIWLASSEDGGRHWAPPVRVNDDRPRPSGKGPDDFRPVIAVNRDGVLGVMWYDRRDNPDNTGWWARFSASADGGETWAPSVRVSEAPFDLARDTQPLIATFTTGGGHAYSGLRGGPFKSTVAYHHFNYVGGHTAGLAATADGLFHPLWVDTRAGVSQIYTAAVRVAPQAGRIPRADAAGLRDVTQSVALELVQARYIARDSVVAVNAVLRNTSGDTLRGPFELRVRSLRSDLGGLRIVGAAPSSTSVIRLTPAGATLVPGRALPPVRLTFKLAHPVSPVLPDDVPAKLVGYGVTLVSLESEVFAR